MLKHSLITTLIASFALFVGQTSFAADDNDLSSNKQCSAIADACKSAGFTEEGMGDKSFWFGCMKPVIFGKTVEGVTVDAKTVKECRKAKITKMKQELKELQAIK